MTTKGTTVRTTAVLEIVILALAITGTAAGSEMTFVLGTDENRAALENASWNVAVDINIYNTTQAMSMNFVN